MVLWPVIEGMCTHLVHCFVAGDVGMFTHLYHSPVAGELEKVHSPVSLSRGW